MSYAATRLGDLTKGHSCFPARPSTSGSPNVFVNSISWVRVSDTYAVHACPSVPPHGGFLSAGSPNITVNGLPAGRVSDLVSCGDTVAQGSLNVFCN